MHVLVAFLLLKRVDLRDQVCIRLCFYLEWLVIDWSVKLVPQVKRLVVRILLLPETALLDELRSHLQHDRLLFLDWEITWLLIFGFFRLERFLIFFISLHLGKGLLLEDDVL